MRRVLASLLSLALLAPVAASAQRNRRGGGCPELVRRDGWFVCDSGDAPLPRVRRRSRPRASEQPPIRHPRAARFDDARLRLGFDLGLAATFDSAAAADHPAFGGWFSLRVGAQLTPYWAVYGEAELRVSELRDDEATRVPVQGRLALFSEASAHAGPAAATMAWGAGVLVGPSGVPLPSLSLQLGWALDVRRTGHEDQPLETARATIRTFLPTLQVTLAGWPDEGVVVLLQTSFLVPIDLTV